MSHCFFKICSTTFFVFNLFTNRPSSPILVGTVNIDNVFFNHYWIRHCITYFSTLLTDHSKMSICHNTLRTTSPFSGYIASPGYPQLPTIDLNYASATAASTHNALYTQQDVDVANDLDMLCNCEVTALSPTAQIELSLLDLYNSDQVSGCG